MILNGFSTFFILYYYYILIYSLYNVEDASQVKEKYLENAIAALEKGEEPTPNTTKAIGCTIKVKK